MDLAIIANFVLFFGALAVNLIADSRSGTDSTDSAASSEPLYNADAYNRTDNGTEGDDSLTADRDNLAWFLGGGDDHLQGSAGADYASLGTGDDEAALGAGSDIGFGGDGDDSLAGGGGNDQLFGGANDDSLTGNIGDDSLAGGDGADSLRGGSGADTLLGGAGNDVISGFTDTAGGAAGLTTDGADQLFGGEGDDHILLGRNDAAAGGAGDDLFQVDNRWNDTGTFRITDYNDADDRIEILYIPRFNAETSLENPPTLTVETTPDGESALIRLNGIVIGQVDGAAGLDPSDILLSRDTETDPNYLPTNYTSEVDGTEAGDTVSGATDPTAWFLNGGNDSLTGSSGNDYAKLGDGNDTAHMGDGNDIAQAGAGADSVSGGDGNDIVLTGDGNDTISGDAGTDRLAGELGHDQIAGGAGADSLLGGAGDDTLSGYSATGAADDALTTIDGIDTLLGGDGNDTLITGHGDLATGGAGADTFRLDNRWGEGSEVALIRDYVRGTDVLQLQYTPVLNTAGVEVPPVITIAMGPGNAFTIIRFNGDPVAHLTGVTTLQVSDIILQRAT